MSDESQALAEQHERLLEARRLQQEQSHRESLSWGDTFACREHGWHGSKSRIPCPTCEAAQWDEEQAKKGRRGDGLRVRPEDRDAAARERLGLPTHHDPAWDAYVSEHTRPGVAVPGSVAEDLSVRILSLQTALGEMLDKGPRVVAQTSNGKHKKYETRAKFAGRLKAIEREIHGLQDKLDSALGKEPVLVRPSAFDVPVTSVGRSWASASAGTGRGSDPRLEGLFER